MLDHGHDGAYAEYVAAQTGDLVRKPKSGADRVIEYRTTPFEEVVSEVVVVLDTIGGDIQERSWQVLKKGGILVATLCVASPETARQHGVRGEGMLVHRDPAHLAQIVALIDAGDVKPAAITVLPLAEATQAHKLDQACAREDRA